MTYRYIYKITCTASNFKGKFYHGQHTTDNLDDGYKGSGAMLRKYYKKHPNDFIKEIISFHNSQEELNQAEYNIIHPNLNNPMCLNLIDGGNLSEETRKKISESCKGKSFSEEHRKHLSEAQKGKKRKPLTKETRRKLSESLKGRISPMKGKHLSEETRRKQSESRKNNPKCCRIPWNKEKKGVQVAWNKGKSPSEETRKKISESHKDKPLSEGHKKKLSESHKGTIPKNKGKHRIYNDPNDKSKGYHYEKNK